MKRWMTGITLVVIVLIVGMERWRGWWLHLPGPSWPPCTQAATPGAEG